MEQPALAPRSAKRKAMDVLAADAAVKEKAAKKRIVAKKLRADVDDLAGLFGKMKSSEDEPVAQDVDMEGQGRRRRRRRSTRKHRKGKKSKKTRKH